MLARHTAMLGIFSSLCLFNSGAAASSAETKLKMPGPGLGNVAYSEAELFTEISRIGWNSGNYNNGMPAVNFSKDRGPHKVPYDRAFGINVGVLLNGYFITVFAPDGGNPPGGFLVYDVSDPRRIKLVKTIYEPEGRTADFREPHALGVTKINGQDYMAVPTAFGVEIWDFTDINNIQQTSKLKLPGINMGDYNDAAWQLWWQAPYLYVAGGNRGLYIVDVTDPNKAILADRQNGAPNPVPTSDLGKFNVGPIFTMGNQMILSSMETTSGFTVLDISHPLNPVVVNGKARIPRYYATCYNGEKLYSSGRDAGGVIAGYDLSNPMSIVTETETTRVTEGLYCATQDNNLFIGAQRHVFKFDASRWTSAGYPRIGETLPQPSPVNPPPSAKKDTDLGQVTPFGNLIFVGGDHGHDTAFRPHQADPDTVPPRVIGASPANGAAFQATTSRIGFGFSDNILPETVNPKTFIVRPKGGAQIAGIYSIQLGIVNFSPSEPLKIDTEYEVILKAGGIKDSVGNGLAEEYRHSFKVGKTPITTSYVHRWPLANGLTDVVSNNVAIAASTPVFADGGIDLRTSSQGLTLKDEKVASVLGGTASVTFKIRTTQVGASSPWLAPGLFGRDQSPGASDVFWGWIDDKGHLNLSVGNTGPTNPGTRSKAPINDGQWHNVIMTRDSFTGEQTVTVDGVQQKTISQPGILGLDNKLQMLGQIQGNPVNLKALISDVRIYSRVLSAGEAKAVFENDQITLSPKIASQRFSLDPADLGLSGATFTWNFGDGSPLVTTTSTAPIAKHEYTAPGNFIVSVIATDSDGVQTIRAFHQATINPVTAQKPSNSSNIAGDGKSIYSIDPDSGTLTAIDGKSLAKSFEIYVGREPRTLAIGPNGHIWVAVQGDDKLVSVNPLTREIKNYSFDYGSAPYGVVFSGNGYGLVTLEGKSAVVVFNPNTGANIGRAQLPNGDLRGVAVSGDSKFAYVTRFRSKMNQAELYRINLADLTDVATIPLPVDRVTAATEASAPGVANYLTQVVISPDGKRAILPSKKDNVIDGLFRNGVKLKADTTVRSILSQVNLETNEEMFERQIDFNNMAPARAAVFAPDGNYIFVAQAESNSVQIIDPYSLAVIGSVQGVGQTPHGLYLDPSSKRLFVNSFLDRKISVHDVSKVLSGAEFITPPPISIQTVQTEPLRADVLAGKRVFYNAADPRMSRDSYISCASCHVDGDSDGIVWDFTQRGEGLRRTISLQGKRGVGELSLDRYTKRVEFNQRDAVSVNRAVTQLLDLVSSALNEVWLEAEPTAEGNLSAVQLKQYAALLNEYKIQLSAPISPQTNAPRRPGAAPSIGDVAVEVTKLSQKINDAFKAEAGRYSAAVSRLHWTGNFDEIQDFEKDIRVEFEGGGFMNKADYETTIDPLGAQKKAGRSVELDNLAAYVSSLVDLPRSPHRDAQGCLTADAQRGQQVFKRAQCASCHGNAVKQDGKRHDVGTVQTSSGKGSNQSLTGTGFDTPNLYGSWQSTSFFHNGQAARLEDVFKDRQTVSNSNSSSFSEVHGGRVSSTEVAPLVAYLKSLDGNPTCRSRNQ